MPATARNALRSSRSEGRRPEEKRKNEAKGAWDCEASLGSIHRMISKEIFHGSRRQSASALHVIPIYMIGP